jgi:hypothetical protein
MITTTNLSAGLGEAHTAIVNSIESRKNDECASNSDHGKDQAESSFEVHPRWRVHNHDPILT